MVNVFVPDPVRSMNLKRKASPFTESLNTDRISASTLSSDQSDSRWTLPIRLFAASIDFLLLGIDVFFRLTTPRIARWQTDYST